MTPFGIILLALAILLMGAVLTAILLLLIEGALYVWDWKGRKALARYKANKRIK